MGKTPHLNMKKLSSWYAFIRFQESWYSYMGFLDEALLQKQSIWVCKCVATGKQMF